MPTTTLATDPMSAVEARRFVRENAKLDSMRHTEADLLVTELVTNVIQHAPGCGRFTLSVETSRVNGVKVAVSHPFDGEITKSVPGLGHTIVERMSKNWGIEKDGDELTVWFVLRTPGVRSSLDGVADEELFLALGDDPDLSYELLQRHSDLASSIARRYRGKGIEDDDLEQVAHMALLKAIQRYDESAGTLRPYAAVTISGEMKKLLRDRGWAVRVPRALQEKVLEVNHARRELTQRLGRPPEIQEIAAEINTTAEEVSQALEAGMAYTSSSVDAPSPETGISLIDKMEDVEVGDLSVDDRLTIEDAINRLPSRQQHILHLRFNEDMTQSEIAEILDISQMHVSRLLRAATDSLKEHLAPDSAAMAEDTGHASSTV